MIEFLAGVLVGAALVYWRVPIMEWIKQKTGHA